MNGPSPAVLAKTSNGHSYCDALSVTDAPVVLMLALLRRNGTLCSDEPASGSAHLMFALVSVSRSPRTMCEPLWMLTTKFPYVPLLPQSWRFELPSTMAAVRLAVAAGFRKTIPLLYWRRTPPSVAGNRPIER